jgi:hypothetical protein
MIALQRYETSEITSDKRKKDDDSGESAQIYVHSRGFTIRIDIYSNKRTPSGGTEHY